MKTKHKILSVLAIMAILAGLWVVVASPASAINPPSVDQQVRVGDTISVTAPETYSASTVISVLWGKTVDGVTKATPVATSPSIITTSTLGACPAFTFKVPACTGAYQISPAYAVTKAGVQYSVWLVDGVTLPPPNQTLLVQPKLQLFDADNLDVTNGQVAAGATVKAVCTGFASGVTVSLIQTTLQQPFAYGVTDTNGSTTINFTAAGNSTGGILARDSSSDATPNYNYNFMTAPVTLALKPSFTTNPLHAMTGTVMTINGLNFSGSPATIANVFVAGIAAVIDAASLRWNGTSCSFNITLPLAVAPGTVDIVVVDSGGKTATAKLLIDPRAGTLNPGSGPKGSLVTINATGLTKSTSTVQHTVPLANVKIASGAYALTVVTPTVAAAIDTNGTMQPITVRLTGTNIPAGSWLITVTDDAGVAAGNYFVVTVPTLTINPTKGRAGQDLAVAGAGWATDQDVTVNLAGKNKTFTPNSTGAFAGTIVTNDCVVGANQITAADAFANTIYTTYTVNPPTVTLSPATVSPGQQVAVSASGLISYLSYTVRIGGNGVGSVTTDSIGSVSNFKVLVPGQLGNLLVELVDAGNVVRASTLLTVVEGTVANTVTAGLAPIDGKYDQVWTLTAGTWQAYDPSDPTNADFNTVAPGMALYIHTTEAVGGVSLGGIVRDLVSGWNLIGWVS